MCGGVYIAVLGDKMRTIQYAIDKETGLVVSRVGSELAWPILDYPSSNFQTKLEKIPVFTVGVSWPMLVWTRKLPKVIKNIHREFWGFSKLK